LYDAGRVMDAATLGLPKAQGEMANRLYFGRNGEEKDLIKCFEWATKAAQGGDETGQFRRGLCYYEGAGVEQNTVEALKWHELAAAQGCEASMHNIGCILSLGGDGVSQDHELSFDWFLKAEEAGSERSINRVAICYYKSQGVAKNLTTARSWFRHGCSWRVGCKFMLGFMMLQGEGGPKEFIDGMSLVDQTANEGWSEANDLLEKYMEAGASFAPC